MKRWQYVFALFLCLTVSYACDLTLGTQQGPTQTTIITQPQVGAPGVTGTPTPAGTGACIAPSVRVGIFGYSCKSGVNTPANNSGQLPLGCVGSLTATPKYQDGTDVPASVHGPNISWTVTVGANVVTLTDFSGENFNKLVTPTSDLTPDPGDKSSGTFTIQATVCGTTGTYTGTVS